MKCFYDLRQVVILCQKWSNLKVKSRLFNGTSNNNVELIEARQSPNSTGVDKTNALLTSTRSLVVIEDSILIMI